MKLVIVINCFLRDLNPDAGSGYISYTDAIFRIFLVDSVSFKKQKQIYI